jgi:hypothetical protein
MVSKERKLQICEMLAGLEEHNGQYVWNFRVGELVLQYMNA